MKKLLSILLAVILIIGMIPATAFTVSAETYSGSCGDNVYWSLDTETGVLDITGEGDMDDYSRNVPWVDYRSDIKTVNIENGVTSIGEYAFAFCSDLTSIEIPNSVTSIADEAFPHCSSLTSIEIPNSVTSIGDWAFVSCENLTSIEIPNSVTSIGDGTFSYCSGLTSITIPNSVTSIGDGAFWDCLSLISITIPNSVTSISNVAFYGCSKLETITVENGNEEYKSVDNCLIEIDTKTLILGCKNSVIPTDGSVTSIGKDAFGGCSGLTSIEIPNSVTSIGEYAFEDCESLTSITIPNSVTSIEYEAFYGCDSLKTVYNNSSLNIKKGSTGNGYIGYYAKYIKVPTYKLFSSTVTYNGKTRTPSVIVKNAQGETLKNGVDYTVSAPSGRKYPGKYKYTVKLKGDYSGTKTLYLEIKPSKQSISKITGSSKKTAKVYYKKDSKVSGYKVYYSTSKSMKGAKSVTVSGYKNYTKTFKTLKSGKTYYFRVRSYKKASYGTVYGDYSSIKSKKVK